MLLQQSQWSMGAPTGTRLSKSAPSSPLKPIGRTKSDAFHVAHKVPVGDTPYVKAKRVQLVEKDPERAIALFWAAINAGDRVDSALKDMAIVMKQQNRSEEAIEAIKSLRNRCSDQSQESLDNILLDLYKRCGRLDDQIALLKHKLLMIQQGLAFNGKRTKTARSQGRKFQVSIDQEATRLLGNLGWALMQKENYTEAEAAYRKALMLSPDNNKMCNLGICLMKQGRVAEASATLKQVRPALAGDGLRGADSHLKAFERAQEMLRDLESKMQKTNQTSNYFEALVSSLIWQPQPCIDYHHDERFADENLQSLSARNALNIDAPPFYSKIRIEKQREEVLGNLKRTRSGILNEKPVIENGGGKWPDLPEEDEFQEAILAAVLAPVIENDGCGSQVMGEGKMGKRLRIFSDITRNLNAMKEG
ncbi:protein POLLENLESS 3-LIKE 2-like [Phalaenopsis equestris]|uniref:protein POLLENLESS 3-LIKE 2-like n=1 Tax=Phalaenopsis equestris TaxID=78828 RepID=UPI0009E4803C|nr:protein POLLENLESS 3-LIKE 2-like [Phalaenopsis equestris]